MKKIALLLTALVVTLAVSAQDKTDSKESKMTDPRTKDHVMMQDGKLTVMKDGKAMDLTTDMTLANGAVVSPSGKLTMKDGSTKVMKDGDCVYMDGKMMKGDKLRKGKM